ncbi:hypothetical protein, partial [Lysobacter panacisoli]|uniref:hypothetical protein n=1 Tax=Lysobacter panacisoli TaxID=1255263 RepID=UPI001E3F060C
MVGLGDPKSLRGARDGSGNIIEARARGIAAWPAERPARMVGLGDPKSLRGARDGSGNIIEASARGTAAWP